MVTLDELKRMAAKELNEECSKSKMDLMKLRLAVAARQNKETSTIKKLRKYIARIKMYKAMLKMEKAPENAKSAVIK